MVDLLKAFGRGILYVLAFPFFIVVLAVFAVIGFIAFIFQLIKSVIFFFTGQKFFPELPEDKQLRLMREEAEAKERQAQEQAQQANQSVNNNLIFEEEPAPIVTPIADTAPKSVEEACFQDLVIKEEKVEPAPAPESIPEQTNEEPLFEEVKEEEPQVEPEQEAPIEDLIPEENNEDPLDDFLSALEEEEPVQQEELETYKPRGSEDSFQDEDNDDSHAGVDIRYDD